MKVPALSIAIHRRQYWKASPQREIYITEAMTLASVFLKIAGCMNFMECNFGIVYRGVDQIH